VGTALRGYLEPIANWFVQFNLPEPIVHWGHPVMMGIVVFVMGGAAAIAGWKGRLATDAGIAVEQKQSHAKIAPLMYLFILMGATGGILSLVMQGEPILESSHFWTGMGAIALLTINATIAATKFGKDNQTLRTAHAYIGSAALVLLVVHAFFGTQLGLSI
jgi:fucose 4-O-acetylase-like acetyltransferase